MASSKKRKIVEELVEPADSPAQLGEAESETRPYRYTKPYFADRWLVKLIESHAKIGSGVFDADTTWFGTYGDWHQNYWLIIMWIRMMVLTALTDQESFLIVLDKMKPDYPDWDSRIAMLGKVVDAIQESIVLERGFDFQDDSSPFDKETEDGKFLRSHAQRYCSLIYALYDEGMSKAAAYCYSTCHDILEKYAELDQPWKTDRHEQRDPDEALRISLQVARTEARLLKEHEKYKSLLNLLNEGHMDDGREDFHKNVLDVKLWIAFRRFTHGMAGIIEN